MGKPEFWCQVIGWLQVIGGLIVGAAFWFVSYLFSLGFDQNTLPYVLFFFLFLFVGLPGLLSGLTTLRFASHVKAYRAGVDTGDHFGLRVAMVFAGLWAAGVIGFFGLSVPPMSLFAILGLITVGLAYMGVAGTAGFIDGGNP